MRDGRHRTIRNSFASDSIQVGLSAKDNFGNMTPIIMTAAATRINTDVVPRFP